MANIISKILARDISTLRAGLADVALVGLGLMATGKPEELTASDNKFTSDACSTREAGELQTNIGDKGGALTALTLSVRGECAKHVITGTKRQYVSPAWARAVAVNRVAAVLRRECGVE